MNVSSHMHFFVLEKIEIFYKNFVLKTVWTKSAVLYLHYEKDWSMKMPFETLGAAVFCVAVSLIWNSPFIFFFFSFFFLVQDWNVFFFLTLKNFVWKAFETNSAMWNSGSRNWPSVKWVFEWWDAFIIPGQANNIIKIPYMSFERKVLKTNPTASNSRWKQDASTKTLFGTCKEYSDNSSDNKERVPVLVMRAIE